DFSSFCAMATTLLMNNLRGLGWRDHPRRLFRRQRQEDFLEAHTQRAKLEEPPTRGDDGTRQIASDVVTLVALALVPDDTAPRIVIPHARDPAYLPACLGRVAPPGVDLHIQRFRTAQAGRQIVGLVDGDDAAFVDDHNALTGLRDLWEDVRAQNDR